MIVEADVHDNVNTAKEFGHVRPIPHFLLYGRACEDIPRQAMLLKSRKSHIPTEYFRPSLAYCALKCFREATENKMVCQQSPCPVTRQEIAVSTGIALWLLTYWLLNEPESVPFTMHCGPGCKVCTWMATNTKKQNNFVCSGT